MMTTAIYRDVRAMFNSAFVLSALVLALAALSQPAAAVENPLPEASMEGPTVVEGAITMSPIPNPGDEVSPISEAGFPDSSDGKVKGEEACLATAIYFEARGESVKGQKAVAEVIVTRARTPGRPKSLCGVVYEGARRSTGCQFSFACDGLPDVVRDQNAWNRAQHIAAKVILTRAKVNPVAGGATYYHATSVSPRWASRMIKVAQIGSQIFYRP
ncbi:MAG: cell wall hydrolase [Micropepsaceae bacterium]